jgi:hypothetical protein
MATWLLAGPAQAEDPPTYEVAGAVTNCSGEHDVHIALAGPGIFDGAEPIEGLIVSAADVTAGRAPFSFRAPRAWYAIAVFEDEDGDGDLAMGLFGPKEPSGFYRAFTGFGPPSFDKIKFELNADLAGADVELD